MACGGKYIFCQISLMAFSVVLSFNIKNYDGIHKTKLLLDTAYFLRRYTTDELVFDVEYFVAF